MTTLPNESFCRTCARHLTRWFEENKRDLPWRRTRAPYAVLVSELMLQQTQVERVKDYYMRWMERFPTLRALAEASEDEVLAAWQGLGYYSRARSLHAITKTLLDAGGETLPADPDALLALPGVGAYTAGAVCSIAFDLPVPAVDGNVRRVFSRLLDLDSDPAKKEAAKLIEDTVKMILDLGRPHLLTQAFMELGATVCTPLASCSCGECPLASLCAAREHGTQSQRPVTDRRVKVLRRCGAALLIGDERAGWLVRRRPKGGLWSDFYEIPWTAGDEKDDLNDCLRKVRTQLDLFAPCNDTGIEETLRFTRWQVRVRLWRTSPLPELPEGTQCVDTKTLLALP
ncbi:MAG: A/G-specific adenine glycosylase, partial [Pyramidobacter sp.]|nr:A/G-specific adenine glycosylase [Pyramidobacter sp.]